MREYQYLVVSFGDGTFLGLQSENPCDPPRPYDKVKFFLTTDMKLAGVLGNDEGTSRGFAEEALERLGMGPLKNVLMPLIKLHRVRFVVEPVEKSPQKNRRVAAAHDAAGGIVVESPVVE